MDMDVKRNPDASKNNWLLRFADGSANEYATEGEANEAMAKIETAISVVELTQTLATATDGALDRWQEYFDWVNAQGPFTDEDLAPLGITAEQLGSCINLLQAFNQFVSGLDQGGPQIWRITINAVRRVETEL
jgi:hypothetical protein